MRLAAAALAIAACGYLAACALLFALQRTMLYYPRPRALPTPTVRVAAADAEVLASMHARPGAKAILYFGGNAEDVSLSLGPLAQAFPGRALYLLHYRGYGGSGGKPSEAALRRDALALFDQVDAAHPEVAVIGRSLGSGLAIWLAARRPVSRLALVTPYDSIAEIAAAQFPLFPVRWLLLDKYESWRDAPAITQPTLVLAAEHDEVIPRASAEKLATRFRSGVARYEVLRGAGHNTVSEHPRYLEALTQAL